MKILRLPAVKAETGHRSHASIYSAIKAGLYTKPVHIGPRSVGWPADEVHAINTARIAGKTDTEIRALVENLHTNRGAYFAAMPSPIDAASLINRHKNK